MSSKKRLAKAASNKKRLTKAKHLIKAATAFFQTSNEEEIATVFQQYPELLEDKVDVIFENAIKNARKNNDHEAVSFFEERYETLQAIRGQLKELPRLEELIERQLKSNHLVEAADAFLKAPNFEEMAILLPKYPELLEDEINIIFEKSIDNARKSGELEPIAFFEQRYQILQELRQGWEEFQNQHEFFQSLIEQADIAEQRYLEEGDVTGLEEAVAAWEQLLQHSDFSRYSTDFRASVFSDSAETYWLRYRAQGQLTDLEHSIHNAQQAVKLTPDNSPNLANYINKLDGFLFERGQRNI